MRMIPQKRGLNTDFSRVVRENEDHLRTLAFRVTKCEAMAQDLVQDVFLKLWEQGHQFYQIENKEAWLYRVMENKLIDHLRKIAADRRMKAVVPGPGGDTGNETEKLLAARESGKHIARAIDNLPSQRRIIFRLNREQQLSHQQIAKELNISRHTVKNQLSSALHYLRSCLKSLRIL
jgi:RNA polymerase sigma-70 factor (family 1)